jgi:hypothetical protein
VQRAAQAAPLTLTLPRLQLQVLLLLLLLRAPWSVVQPPPLLLRPRGRAPLLLQLARPAQVLPR